MAPATPILDDYADWKNVPKTAAKEVYKLTEGELKLIRAYKKRHGYFKTSMTLYSRASLVRFACEKYGCTRKNIAEVLAQANPPIVKKLVQRGGGQKKAEPKTQKKGVSTKKKAAAAPASDTDSEDAESCDSD